MLHSDAQYFSIQRLEDEDIQVSNTQKLQEAKQTRKYLELKRMEN
jgi:hypothetical protein